MQVLDLLVHGFLRCTVRSRAVIRSSRNCRRGSDSRSILGIRGVIVLHDEVAADCVLNVLYPLLGVPNFVHPSLEGPESLGRSCALRPDLLNFLVEREHLLQ